MRTLQTQIIGRRLSTPQVGRGASRENAQEAADGFRVHSRQEAEQPEETLIIDPRGQLRPAQQVEQKLVALLRDTMLPISLLRTSVLPETVVAE